jgi:hypothetical protein
MDIAALRGVVRKPGRPIRCGVAIDTVGCLVLQTGKLGKPLCRCPTHPLAHSLGNVIRPTRNEFWKNLLALCRSAVPPFVITDRPPGGSVPDEEDFTVKYMLLIIGNQDAEPPTAEPSQGLMEAFMAYHQSVVEAGIMVESNVLDSFETATSVQVTKSGERLVTDGPFAETREYLGGYYILDLPDLDVAIDWAGRCPGSRYGRVEIRPIQELNVS